MSMVDTLKRARSLVASGWSEPFCRDSQGRICGPEAEDVERYSVLDAIAHAAGTERENVWRAWEALESVVTPLHHAYDSFLRSVPVPAMTEEELLRVRDVAGQSLREPGMQQWLEEKGRHPAAVLRAFDIAILRASALERATRGAA